MDFAARLHGVIAEDLVCSGLLACVLCLKALRERVIRSGHVRRYVGQTWPQVIVADGSRGSAFSKDRGIKQALPRIMRMRVTITARRQV